MGDEQSKKTNPDYQEDWQAEAPRLTDSIKKVLGLGLGAAFMTEESIRSYLAEMKLPKDVLSGILSQAAKSKSDLSQKLGDEFSRVLSKVNWLQEFSRFATEHKFKISAEIEVLKKTDSVDAKESNSD